MTLIDSTTPVRAGEEIDAKALEAYLRSELGDDVTVTVEQFPGGHSNLTYLIKLGERELVLRRPPFRTTVKTAHDMSREFRVLSALGPHFPKVPKPVLHCQDISVLGSEFYLMERIEGAIIRARLPKGLELSPEQATTLSENLIDTLAELHDLDIGAMSLKDFGKPEGYVQRQVEGWRDRYLKSQTDDIPAMAEVGQWLQDNRPEDHGPSLIHNDFKLDNVVLNPNDPTEIIGVLDWEMATVGDPYMDLGTSLSYWIEAKDPAPMQMLPFGPTALPGMLTRESLLARYQERRQVEVELPVFYYCFGLFKTAVVAQQIYYRFNQGHTKDQRFAQMLQGVRVLSTAAQQAIDRGTL
jgi:aminoglycoside phosphotransferase (APT) family kinase protein